MSQPDCYTVGLVKRKGSPMTPTKIKLDKTTPLSVLRALALSFARDIDNGEDCNGELRNELERVMSLVPDAREARFT